MQNGLCKLALISALIFQLKEASAEIPIVINVNQLSGNEVANSQKGTVSGCILDQKTKEPLTGATIQIEGTTIGTVADLDGNFTISNLSPGKYR